MAPRRRYFQTPLSDAEHAMLRRLAETDGISGADVVRGLIRRAHAKLDAKAPAPVAPGATS